MFAIRNKLTNEIIGINVTTTTDGEVDYELSTYSTHKLVVTSASKYLLDRMVREDYKGYGLAECPYRWSSIRWEELEVVELGIK